MENPIEMDDLGVPLFLETPKSSRGHHLWAWNVVSAFLHELGGYYFSGGVLKVLQNNLIEDQR